MEIKRRVLWFVVLSNAWHIWCERVCDFFIKCVSESERINILHLWEQRDCAVAGERAIKAIICVTKLALGPIAQSAAR